MGCGERIKINRNQSINKSNNFDLYSAFYEPRKHGKEKTKQRCIQTKPKERTATQYQRREGEQINAHKSIVIHKYKYM